MPSTDIVSLRPRSGWANEQAQRDLDGHTTMPEVDALIKALRKRHPAVYKWPAFHLLVEAGATPEPACLVSHVSSLNGHRWEVWRWAELTSGHVDFKLSIEQYGKGGSLLVSKVLPLSLERGSGLDPLPRFKIDANTRAKLITTWPALVRQLKRSGVLAGLGSESGIYVSRFVAGICELNVRLGAPHHLEVAHLDRCSLNDNASNLDVLPKAEHDAYDDATREPPTWVAGILDQAEQYDFEAHTYEKQIARLKRAAGRASALEQGQGG